VITMRRSRLPVCSVGDVVALWRTVDTRRDRARLYRHYGAGVAGRIVELHVIDNKLVRKGDLLMVSTRPTTQ